MNKWWIINWKDGSIPDSGDRKSKGIDGNASEDNLTKAKKAEHNFIVSINDKSPVGFFFNFLVNFFSENRK